MYGLFRNLDYPPTNVQLLGTCPGSFESPRSRGQGFGVPADDSRLGSRQTFLYSGLPGPLFEGYLCNILVEAAICSMILDCRGDVNGNIFQPVERQLRGLPYVERLLWGHSDVIDDRTYVVAAGTRPLTDMMAPQTRQARLGIKVKIPRIRPIWFKAQIC